MRLAGQKAGSTAKKESPVKSKKTKVQQETNTPTPGNEKPQETKGTINSDIKVKVNKMPPMTAAEKKRRKKQKTIKIAVVSFVSVIAIIVGSKFGYDYYQQKQYEDQVNQIAARAGDIINRFHTVLTAKAPTTWIYDRDENLTMTLKVSNALQAVDTVPSILYQTIMTNSNNSPADVIVNEYLVENAIPLTEGVYDGYKQCLTTQSTQDDLIKYLATVSKYGGEYVGATDAATNYFGLSLAKLSEEQLTFLASSYRNDNFNIEQYLEDNNMNEDRLGLIIRKSEYSAIRSKVLSELQSIDGIDVMNQSYMVKLSTSTQQQSILQTAIDQGMRQLIDLNGDGTYAFDCSVVVADRSTGYIRAYVPGRSCSIENAKPFVMNTLGFRDNFNELYRQLSDAYTFKFTLREVTKANGDKTLRSIEDLFSNQLLVESKPLDLVDSIDMLRSMYSSSDKFKGTTMVYQIADLAGTTLYKASSDNMLDISNNNLSQMFSTENDLTHFGTDFELDTGIISFESTADYTLVILAGSGAVGGSVTSEQRAVLQNTINTLKTAVATFYPTPVNPVWNGAGMDAAMTVCHSTNQSYVEKSFMGALDELLAITVESFSSRSEFEAKYEEIKAFIDEYEVFVGEVYADSLRDALDRVRTERSADLIKYSVG